mmetsp:Transcript_58143/g.87631  ORF Transcript_58143/g.87631 Transcript_58143/m.87631 type:complete len:98 (+) Transcript_58143:951-1244(+)
MESSHRLRSGPGHHDTDAYDHTFDDKRYQALGGECGAATSRVDDLYTPSSRTGSVGDDPTCEQTVGMWRKCDCIRCSAKMTRAKTFTTGSAMLNLGQ